MNVSGRYDLENWMGNLPDKLRTVPIIHLAIPGSHDSMTASITHKSGVAPDAEPFLQRLKFLGPLLKFFMYRWSRTQANFTLNQLKIGVRYFDFRVAIKHDTTELYFVHGLYAGNVIDALNEIESFLRRHPLEVVILDFQHFYAFHQDNHEKLMSTVESIFQEKLMPYTLNMNQITLKNVTVAHRSQVVAIYRSDAARLEHPLLWPGANFPTPWPDTVSVPELIAKLNSNLKSRPRNAAFVSQCVLTPTVWFVCKNIYSSLKSKCVKPLQEAKYKWLQEQSPGDKGLNIVICDYVDSDFAREVILLNFKLLGENVAVHLTPIDDNQ